MVKKTIPSSYWSYRWYRIGGKKIYVKVRKVRGKIKIRKAKKRRKK